MTCHNGSVATLPVCRIVWFQPSQHNNGVVRYESLKLQRKKCYKWRQFTVKTWWRSRSSIFNAFLLWVQHPIQTAQMVTEWFVMKPAVCQWLHQKYGHNIKKCKTEAATVIFYSKWICSVFSWWIDELKLAGNCSQVTFLKSLFYLNKTAGGFKIYVLRYGHELHFY